MKKVGLDVSPSQRALSGGIIGPTSDLLEEWSSGLNGRPPAASRR